MQALLPAMGRAGLMSAASNVAGQTAQFAGRMVPYLPAMAQFFGGDRLGAGVTAGATKLAPKGAKTVVGLATSLLAPPVLGAVGSGAQQLAGAVTGARREEGKSGLFGGGVGDLDAGKINELAKSLGMTQVEVAEKLMPTYNAMRDADMNRQMQLNQQLGQLTGALNQQKYMAQLAGGAQSEAGATTRSILTAANPYAQSAFQYRG